MRSKGGVIRGGVVVLGLLWLQAATAAPWQLDSGTRRAVMIELYTSQGCSSCPPAEAFLNKLVDNPRLWRPFVPLAWHVDYWDYLGWRDRYALPDNAQRQRRYAALGHVRGVYTPALLVNGRGWRPGWKRRLPDDGAAAGRLQLRVEGGQVTASYQAQAGGQGALQLQLALLGSGLETDIAAGENRGRHSRHDFVVLDRRHLPGSGPHWQGRLPVAVLPAQRLALVAWVSRDGDPTPLQAVGGWLPPGQAADQSSAGPSTKSTASKPWSSSTARMSSQR